MTGIDSLQADSREYAKLYCERDMREIELQPFCGGMAAVFSMSSPGSSGVNEDCAALLPFDETSGALVVADGAGGLRGGAQASNITVESLRDTLEQAVKTNENLREAILGGIELANRSIDGLSIGAASTVAVAEIHDTRLRTYHAGDSQIMILGAGGVLKFLTVSHSPMGYAVQMGLLDERQAIVHEDRHLLFNVVGLSDMHIEMGMEVELEIGDTVLIACDGLFDNLIVSEVAEFFREGPLGNCTKNLIEACLKRMSGVDESQPAKPDDLTILVFRFGESTPGR